MFKIAIVEDDEITRLQLCDFVNQYGKEQNQEIEVFTFGDGSEILAEYQPIYDIILLDIEMPQVNGMDAAEQIRKCDEDVVLVFITNMLSEDIQ